MTIMFIWYMIVNEQGVKLVMRVFKFTSFYEYVKGRLIFLSN